MGFVSELQGLDVDRVRTVEQLRERDTKGSAQPGHVLDADAPASALEVADRVGAPPESLTKITLTPASASTLGAHVAGTTSPM
jgi:hypothetical protein